MIGGYGLYSLGELLVSGLGLAMIARYVPARMGGFMMGAYLRRRRHVAVHRQHRGELRGDSVRHHRSAAVAADLHELFNKLGVVGIVLHRDRDRVLPLMNKLSATHHAGAKRNAAAHSVVAED